MVRVCAGIGEATVKGLAALGAQVVIADITETQGLKLADLLGDNVTFLRTDVTCANPFARNCQTPWWSVQNKPVTELHYSLTKTSCIPFKTTAVIILAGLRRMLRRQ